MSRTEELEQLKKEYREIPIPQEGVKTVQKAVQRAIRRKRIRKRALSGLSVAAAAAVLILVLPNSFPMMKNADKESAPDQKGESYHAAESPLFPSAADKNKDEYGMMTEDAASDYHPLKDVQVRERIAEEICRRLREMEIPKTGKIGSGTDIRQELVWSLEEQEYYYNEEGLLVIVFAPGEIAPLTYGEMEFVIPEEVIYP